MGYFLHKAQERGGAVEERRFRYKGPEPRSKETAISGCAILAVLANIIPSRNPSPINSVFEIIINLFLHPSIPSLQHMPNRHGVA